MVIFEVGELVMLKGTEGDPNIPYLVVQGVGPRPESANMEALDEGEVSVIWLAQDLRLAVAILPAACLESAEE